MFFNLLHFGSGLQAIHYFIFCFVGILGTVQGVAVRYHRSDLVWLDRRKGYALSVLMVAGSFAWFFLVDQDIFIPGLAGGELFTLFATAFAAAVAVTRVVAFFAIRVRALRAPAGTAREKEPLL